MPETTVKVNLTYGLVVIIASAVFILLEIGLLIAYGICIGLNNGNGAIYTLLSFNVVFAFLAILVAIVSIVGNINIIERLRDCMRPVQFYLYIVILVAFIISGICAVILNAFIFIYSNLLPLAVVSIIVNFAAHVAMLIFSAINVGWVRCQMRSST
jgi:hypothetical protein